MPSMNMVQALNSAMDVMLARDPRVVVLGEDVGYFGGVFRVTDGLQKKHGAHRVLDTPIAEGGIVDGNGPARAVWLLRVGRDAPVAAREVRLHWHFHDIPHARHAEALRVSREPVSAAT